MQISRTNLISVITSLELKLKTSVSLLNIYSQKYLNTCYENKEIHETLKRDVQAEKELVDIFNNLLTNNPNVEEFNLNPEKIKPNGLNPYDYLNAITVQNASNLSGVVNSFMEAIQKIRAEGRKNPENNNSDYVNDHPITKMYVSAIMNLTNSGCTLGFANALDNCKQVSESELVTHRIDLKGENNESSN
jgi:hypothetical protein